MPRPSCVLFLFVASSFCATAIGADLLLAQTPSAQAANDVRAACAGDVQKLCANVSVGGGRILACLKEHQDQVSDGCKQALAKAMGQANGGSGDAPAPAPDVPSSTAPAKSTAKSGASSKSVSPRITPTPFKETLAERIVSDPAHGNMRAVTFQVPAKWRVSSKLEWHYNWIENPMSYSFQAENPDNAEAYFHYPLLRLEKIDVAPQMMKFGANRTNYKPGDRMPLGAIYYPPLPPLQGLAAFIKMVRPNVTNLKWIGTQELPDMVKALSMGSWPGDHGLAIKISYDLDGKPVEEAFFGVYYSYQGSNSAVSAGQARLNAGDMKQTNWGFRALQSFRAPAGTLEKRISVFCVIAKSLFVNPKWDRLLNAIGDQLHKDFNEKLKQNLDDIRAADATMQQALQQEKAFQADFEKSEAAYRNSIGSGGGSSRTGGKSKEIDDSYLNDGGKRSAADHFDDFIIGVDTMLDPENGNHTIQLSNEGQYHFTNGLGDYFTTDDPNLTPEKAGRSGTWYPMTEAP